MTVPRIKAIAPGIIIALTVAFAAMFLGEHYDAPSMLFAVLLGMALSFLHDDEKCAPGLEFSATTVLKIGVALLGIRLTVSHFVALGAPALGWIAVGIVSTIIVGWGLTRITRFGGWFGVLTGGAVGICGASAALAIATVLPRNDKNEQYLTLTVLGVTSLSTLVMILYPVLSLQLGWSDSEAGVFFGATIHDVAQVAGAGFSISDEAGNTAVMVKLIRVAMLLPVVLAIGFVARNAEKANGGGTGKARLLPPFLVFFVLLVALNSAVSIPDTITQQVSNLSKLLLTTGVAALGVRSQLKETLKLGLFPVFVIIAETVWIALLFIIVMKMGWLNG